MALTKAQLQTLINTNLASGTVIPAVKHREVETELLNFADQSVIKLPKNIGWFSGLNIGSTAIGTNLSVGGDIAIANVTANDGSAGYNVIRCTFNNAMVNTNFKVNITIQSQGTLDNDARLIYPVWKPFSTTVFDFAVRESSSGAQNLKVHIEVIQL